MSNLIKTTDRAFTSPNSPFLPNYAPAPLRACPDAVASQVAHERLSRERPFSVRSTYQDAQREYHFSGPEYVTNRTVYFQSHLPDIIGIYTGEWENGKPNGKGSLQDISGSKIFGTYEGTFVNGQLQGYGKRRLGDSVYEGNFLDGQEHGQGKWSFSDGAIEEGEFDYGVLQGKGKSTQPDGTIYEGDFVNHQFHGKGVLKYPNGVIIEGHFYGHRFHGEATYRVENCAGRAIAQKIQFNMGKLVGHSDRSRIGESLFLALLFGYSQAAPPNYALSILSDYLVHYFQNDPAILSTVIMPLVEACQLTETHPFFFEEKVCRVVEEKLKQGQPYLLEYGCKNHQLGLNLVPSQDGRWIECEIFNSGKGLRQFHNYNSDLRKYQTMKKARIPIELLTGDKLHELINYRAFEDAVKAYAAMGIRPNVSNLTQSVTNEPVWQRKQKSNNCNIEWIFAYLKNKLPPEVYAKMRRDLFCASLKAALSQSDLPADILSLPRIQHKMRKLKIDPERDLGVPAEISPAGNSRGTFKYADGSLYEGELVDGLPHGKGVLRFIDGGVYEGEFVDGDRHGLGIMKYSTGGIYEGEFSDDAEHGKGILKYADGGLYEGDFVDGNRHGQGVTRYPDGWMYKGDYFNDKRHGQGILRHTDGSVYEGNFVNDNKHGQGRTRYPDGRVYKGGFVGNKRHGLGELTYPNGKVYECTYVSGTLLFERLNSSASAKNVPSFTH
jgi:hypothetical protein